MFYCIMAASDDEDTQKKGIISILYVLEAAESAPPTLAWVGRLKGCGVPCPFSMAAFISASTSTMALLMPLAHG
jgi:hypothetical protein